MSPQGSSATSELPHLLEQLEAVWRANYPAAVETLRPGLTGEQVDAATEGLPFPIPEDARLLWKWHDGQSPRSEAERLGGSLRLLTADQAVARYFFNLRTFEDVHVELPDSYRPNWLPLIDGESAHSVLIDTQSAEIVLHSWMDHALPLRAAFPSLADVIRLCIAAIEEGAWQFPGDGKMEATYRDWEAVERLAETPAALALLRG